jgi:hypothetical protein
MGPRFACCLVAWASVLLVAGCPQFQSDFVISSDGGAMRVGDSEPEGSSSEASDAAPAPDSASKNGTMSEGGVSDGAVSDGTVQEADTPPGEGSEAGAEAGSEAGPCSAGSLQCSAFQPQVCSSGEWHNVGALCSNQACVAGACVGVCTPGATQCSGPMPDSGVATGYYVNTQTCNSSGQWGADAPCSQPTPVCQNGSCACPNSTVCNGVCVDEEHDSNNCGSCGTVCPNGYTCQGSCGPACSCNAVTIGTACANAACARSYPGTTCQTSTVPGIPAACAQ